MPFQSFLVFSYAEPVQIASIQTLSARAIRSRTIDLPRADLVVIDEAHHCRAKTYRKIIESYPKAIILGMTATPCRGDGRGLGNVFDCIIECPPVQALIDLGFLVPTRVYAPVVPDLKGVRVEKGDYAKGQLAERMNQGELIGDIITTWLRLSERRKTVVFASGVEHSVHIRDEFRRAGIMAEHVDGSTPVDERESILAGKACAVDHKTVGKVKRELTGEIPSDRTVTYRDRHGNESEMRVSGSTSSGSTLEKVLAGVSNEALISECRRRGLEVGDV